MLTFLKNNTIYHDKYQSHDEAVVIFCYYNSQGSLARRNNVLKFYDSIKHLNHRAIELSIKGSKFELPDSKYIKRISTDNLLWHKETLLNKIIKDLPAKFKYVFWVDADVIFENKNWLVEGVKELKTNNIIQPFYTCYHLASGQTKPIPFDLALSQHSLFPNKMTKNCWRSFCSNVDRSDKIIHSTNYNDHGHVGFAWGARREILDQVPLYERALIGGADHIIAHAAVGDINHECIAKSFTDDIDEVKKWMKRFSSVVKKKVGFVNGNLYHMYHGEIEKRDYFNRIKQFTPMAKKITERDSNGLYYTKEPEHNNFLMNYFIYRELFDGSKQQDNFVPGGGSFGGGGASDSCNEDKPVEVVKSESTVLPAFIPFS